jgi:hypothetical protein
MTNEENLVGAHEPLEDFEREHDRRLRDRIADTSLALWSALLTGNGLILTASAFIAPRTGPQRYLLFVLLGLVVWASSCLVLNYRNTQMTYRLFREDWKNRHDPDRAESITAKQAQVAKKKVRGREVRVLWLMAFQLVIVAVLILLE